MWAVQLSNISLVIGGIWSAHQGLKPKATLIYNCLKEGQPPSEAGERMKFLGLDVYMISGTILTLTEVIIYCLIIHDLYVHDKLMKLVLKEDVIKKRMQKNLIDLFGHMCQFILEITWILSSFSA